MNGFYTINKFLLTLVITASLSSIISCSDSSRKKHPQRAQLVKVATVINSPMQSEQMLSGTLEALRTVQIFNQEEGLILDIPVYQGDKVDKSQLLVQLESKLINAELNKAKIKHRQAALDLKRLKQLRKKRLTTEEAISSAQSTLDLAAAEETVLHTRLQHTRIHAPFSGVITERLKESGDVVAKFTHLLSLDDTRQLKARINISELLLPSIQVGSSLKVYIDALGDQSIDATVLRIYPTIDKITRQGTIEVLISNPPSSAKPGQLCRLVLSGKTTPKKNIPLNAVKHNVNGSYVFRVINNKAMLTPIKTGIQLGNNIEVISGLNKDDKVITQGFLNLKDNKPVKIVSD